jgi:hypothetical protein
VTASYKLPSYSIADVALELLKEGAIKVEGLYRVERCSHCGSKYWFLNEFESYTLNDN